MTKTADMLRAVASLLDAGAIEDAEELMDQLQQSDLFSDDVDEEETEEAEE